MQKKWTLATKGGCFRLLALALAIIVLASCGARLIASDGGNIKISRVMIDLRGGAMDAELYYPAYASEKVKLPAVIVAHGGGVTNGNMKGISEELARRGFVVMNVNGYGVGLSEQPIVDDGGQGEDGFNRKKTPAAMLDALNYVRSLAFVNPTRVGMTGHSNGSRRSGYAAILDCGYLTFNDVMLNVLHDVFGQEIAESELYEDADKLAEAKLNEDELKFYMILKEEKAEEYNKKLKSLCLIGSDANLVTVAQKTTVAGHEVLRNCQVNFGIVDGAYDDRYRMFISSDAAKTNWFTGGKDVELEQWYIIDDQTQSSTNPGKLYEISSVSNETLNAAIENRDTRVICFSPETHSKNFFSNYTTAYIVKYFEQTLSYNRGELTDPATKPLESRNMVFMWRELLNLIAMFAMVGMCLALAGLLLKTEFFAPCVAPEASAVPAFNKKKYWLCALIAVAAAFIAIHTVNNIYGPGLPWSMFIPYFSSWWLTVIYVAIVAIGAVVILLLCWLTDRKQGGNARLKALNIAMKFTAILKAILLAVILLAAAYTSLVLIEDIFGQDYRFWMAAFSEIRVDYWRYVWRVAILMFPTFLVIGAATNYTIRQDIPKWRDTLQTVIINSAGVWLCCLINYLVVLKTGDLFSSFISCYGFLILVPITVYITRKCYDMTKSIWLGAAFNALLLSWTVNTTIGLNVEVFIGQSWLSNFLNM